MMRTRVKICGITRAEDAREAVRQGADALGFVFYPPSPRAVTFEQARKIVDRLPPFVTVVGLFVDAERAEISEALTRVRIDLLQFHGRESPEQCSGHGRPYIKAVRMREGVDLTQLEAKYMDAAALLLDSYQAGQPGGTGTVFDWGRVPPEMADRIVLAGGLDPDNVEAAVRRVRPYAVDVSGGVERAKGIKDAARIAAFLRGVQRGDYS
jgi:phosphoribosylanthranilate isomerase